MELYGLKYSHFLEPQKGYRNYSYPIVLLDGSIANLILYKSEPDILAKIKLANAVSNYLSGHGLPVRRTIDPRVLKVQAKNSTRYAALYNYLPGQTIPWEAYTRAHLKVLGQGLAQTHGLLANVPKTEAPDVADDYLEIVRRMDKYFSNSGVASAMQNKLNLSLNGDELNRFIKVLEVCKKLPNQQMLHMDFVRGNILFSDLEESSALKATAGGALGRTLSRIRHSFSEGGEDNGRSRERQDPRGFVLSGILDFEKAAYGHRLFDIARTLAFLLVDCKYKTEEQIRKNFLISGYVRRGQKQVNDVILKSESQKISLLETLVDLFMTYDLYKFLRHNPYESLPQNEHYVRTRDLLVSRGIVAQKVLE